MTNNVNSEEKQWYIEINGEKVYVTEEVYRAYKRPIWAEQKRKERSRRCRFPNGKRCDKDCSRCSYMKTGSILSIDSLQRENGFEAASKENIEENYIKKELLAELHRLLDELEEIDCKILIYFSEGKSQREIADEIGFKSHKSVGKRLNKIFFFLREKLKYYK